MTSRFSSLLHKSISSTFLPCIFLFSTIILGIVVWNPTIIDGDDAEYLCIVKSIVQGTPFIDITRNDSTFASYRSIGFPLVLSILYPIIGDNWPLYAGVSFMSACLLPLIVFLFCKEYFNANLAMVISIMILFNPIVWIWANVAYSDLPFTVFLILGLYSITKFPESYLNLIFPIVLVSLRSAGIPFLVAYAGYYLLKKKWKHFTLLTLLSFVFLFSQIIIFKEIPGITGYSKIGTSNYSGDPVNWLERVTHNFRSIFITLLPSSLFPFLYAHIPASKLKVLLALFVSGSALLGLLRIGKVNMLIPVCFSIYCALLLVWRPEDVVHRMMLPILVLFVTGIVFLLTRISNQKMQKVITTMLLLVVVCDNLLILKNGHSNNEPTLYSFLKKAKEKVPVDSKIYVSSASIRLLFENVRYVNEPIQSGDYFVALSPDKNHMVITSDHKYFLVKKIE